MKYLSALIFLLLSLPVSAQNFEHIRTHPDHQATVTDAVFSPSGKWYAIGDMAGRITIWETAAGKKQADFVLHSGKVTDITFDRAEKRILTAGYDGKIKVIDWRNGREIISFDNSAREAYYGVQGNEPTFAVWGPDETEVWFGGYNMELLRGRLADGSTAVIRKIANLGITCGLPSPDAQFLAFGYGGITEILDMKASRTVKTLGNGQPDAGAVCEIGFAKDGTLGSWSSKGLLSFWDLKAGEMVGMFKATEREGSSCFAFSPDGSSVLTGNDGPAAKIWNRTGRKVSQRLEGHRDAPEAMDFSPDGQYILTSDGKNLKVWNFKEPEKPEDEISEEPEDEFVGLENNESIDLHLQFPQSRAVLTNDSRDKLDKVVAFMKRNPNVRIKLEGHTDDVGNAAQNLELSRKRCAEAKKYLSDQAIDSQRIETEGFGGSRPIASNSNPKTRQLNRRVEMRILSR